MKIAMISLYVPSGSKIGSGYQAHYMANAMVQRGHDVTLFTPCAPSEDALYKQVTVSVGESNRTFRFAWNLRQIDFSPFDVIHAHGDDYLLWNRNKPVHIRTMHGSCFAEAFHVPGVKEKLRMGLLGLSEILATQVADRTICVSTDTLRYYPNVHSVIVNGVDTSAFTSEGIKELTPTILFVGTYHNRKRGKLLFDAFHREIRPVFPNAHLWMVCGDAPSADGVTVFGRVPLAQLTDLYRRAWIFCLPSSYEGFGVPYIEALASGTPVVATPNPGAKEVLDNGRYGLLVEPENIGRALIDLLTDRDQRDRMRQKGLERVREYSWERIVEQYEAVYADVRTGRRSRNIQKVSAL